MLLKQPIARQGCNGVPTGMAASPAPILFDRALLRVRRQRAVMLGPASFLLDRVAEDMAERLRAVVREFSAAADIGTPGDSVRNTLARRVTALTPVDLPDRESEPLSLAPGSLDLAVSGLA